MSDITRINQLTDELYKELVNQGLWDSFKTINNFSKAGDVYALERRVEVLQNENRAFRDLGFQRDQAIKRFRKLDVIHNCQCEGCTGQRTKFNTLFDSVSAYDIKNNIEEVKKSSL